MATKLWVGGTGGSEGNFNTATNWSGGVAPGAGDDVYIRGSQNIDDGLDWSSVNVDAFIVERSYTGTIGSSTAPFQIGITDTSGRIEFSGTGEAHLDVGGSAVSMTVHNTAGAAVGSYGLTIKGTGLVTLSIEGGKVGIATGAPADTATITTLRCLGGHTTVGAGTTVTNIDVGNGGVALVKTDCADMDIRSGRVTTGVDAAITSSVTLWGGRLIHNSTGTIASAIIQGGELDVSRGGLNVTISTLKLNEGSFIYDPESVTVSSIVEADYPVHWSSVKGN